MACRSLAGLIGDTYDVVSNRKTLTAPDGSRRLFLLDWITRDSLKREWLFEQ
jgi:hypothetical protein